MSKRPRSRRAVTRPLTATFVVGAIVLSGCAATQDSVVSQPTNASASGSVLSAGSPGVINRDFPEDLNEWFRKPVQETISKYSTEKLDAVVAKAAGKKIAGSIAGSALGGVLGYTFGWLFGVSDSQQEALDKQFEIVKENLNTLDASVNNLNTNLAKGFTQVGAKLDGKACKSAKDGTAKQSALLDDAQEHAKEFLAAMKNAAAVDSQAVSDDLEAQNELFEDAIAPMKNDVNFLSNYVKSLAGSQEAGDGSADGVLVSCYRAIANASPMLTSEASKLMLQTWAYYYSQFRSLAALYLTYWSGVAGKDAGKQADLKRKEQGVASLDSILLDRYPLQVPDRTFYDQTTKTWFATGLEGGTGVFNVEGSLDEARKDLQAWGKAQFDSQFQTWKGFNSHLVPLKPATMSPEVANTLYSRLLHDGTGNTAINAGKPVGQALASMTIGNSGGKQGTVFDHVAGIQTAPPVGSFEMLNCRVNSIEGPPSICHVSYQGGKSKSVEVNTGLATWTKTNILPAAIGEKCAEPYQSGWSAGLTGITSISYPSLHTATMSKPCGNSTPWIGFGAYTQATRDMFVNTQPRRYQWAPSVDHIPTENVPRPIEN